MNVDGVKITWVSAEESLDHQDRPGFAPVCQYGIGMETCRNEFGVIVHHRIGDGWAKTSLYSPWLLHGFPVTVLERIFVVEPTP